jgi:trehalose 6-phosphate synthase/phosphatase
LVTAIQSLPNQDAIRWIGTADFKSEDWEEYRKSAKKEGIEIVPMFLEKETEDLYYNGFSNGMLWPLFHYFPTFAAYEETQYKAYKTVNALFAEKIRQLAGPDDIVWVHDYHLMLVPGLLKQGGKPVPSSFFLHIPFPSYEIIKLIPEEWRSDLLKSLLCADVVGFQTTDYSNHFKISLSFFLGIECVNNYVNQHQHITCIKEYPISIDYEKFNSAFDEPEVATLRNQVLRKYEKVKIIFSLDRLDYSKGVMNRLQAYEQLLESYQDLHEKVVFVINVIPSRENIPQYAERKKMIEENISRINGLYSSLQWQPVIYQYRSLAFSQLLASYTACDVALVTPLRDGMNLVAKEFIASRKDGRGVLILSEFAGAATELSSAIFVNPNDINLMKEAMLQAITLPVEEQEERMRRMQEVIEKNDVIRWMHSFLDDATGVNLPAVVPANIMTQPDRDAIIDAYRKSTSRLILLDYDGTLIPFYNKPEEAIPGDLILDLIGKLTRDKKNEIMLISGRDADTLQGWFQNSDIGIAAEHGILYRPSQSQEWFFPREINLTWKENVKGCLARYLETFAGSFVEEKKYSIAFHYRGTNGVDEELLRLNLSKELIPLNVRNNFDVLYGNKVIEIKSAHTNKGRFVSQFIGKKQFDFILAIGDDTTDEDMFKALTEKHHHTIKVGLDASSAKYNVVGVNNVLSLLQQLSSSMEPETEAAG